MKLLSYYLEQQAKRQPELATWKNHIVGDQLSYSYRNTLYDRITYPSVLHYHDYYELVIFVEGNIRYVSDGCIYQPLYGDIILIPPGSLHMSAINCESTRYERHVFYLYPSAFDAVGHSSLTSFLSRARDGAHLKLSSFSARQELMELLGEVNAAFKRADSPLDAALGLAQIIRVFYLLNKDGVSPESAVSSLPDGILRLKRYIDQNFSQITSAAQVAKQFFYSREYVARQFRKHLDTTVSEYITQKRVAESCSLIRRGVPLLDAAFQVGFGSASTFIRAFRAVMGITPSEYRKCQRELFFKP